MPQTIHTLSVDHPFHYWSTIIALLLVVCYGWYRLGAMRQVPAFVNAPRPRPLLGYVAGVFTWWHGLIKWQVYYLRH